MKSFKNPAYAGTLAIALLAALPVSAQTMDHSKMGDMKMGNGISSLNELTDGEVRKVDNEAKKITIRHGELKNLGMPAMTMVFQVKDPAMLDQVKPGDKVKFKVEKPAGAMVVTEIHAVK